jgi:hypothetical protein
MEKKNPFQSFFSQGSGGLRNIKNNAVSNMLSECHAETWRENRRNPSFFCKVDKRNGGIRGNMKKILLLILFDTELNRILFHLNYFIDFSAQNRLPAFGSKSG